MASRKPGMRDIARAVGTSAVTVSKALAGKPGMSREMRDRILKKAEEMGYVNPRGGTGRAAEHLNIGVLIPDRYFQPESFYAEMYRLLIRHLSDRGHFGLLEILSEEGERELSLPNLMMTGRADAMILLGEPSKAYYRKIAQAGLPSVFLDFYDEQANADAVVGDNSYGAYRLTSHLIRRGHRDIGFVGNRKATSSIMDRFLGYYRAMLMNDLPVRENWILPDRELTGGLVAPELPAELPSAFVCNCDLTARLMIETLRDHGLRVPEDISVTGFDDFLPGNQVDVGLSTFRVDTEGMIELAVETLLERCSGDKKPFGRLVVSGQPVYRGSEIIRN